ncbi:MAG: DNA polymerase Y family protein [Myxococcaceae bacterium]|nr:MAG: DNA polymerase Y family protein [Myxococcaceae bacterium]
MSQRVAYVHLPRFPVQRRVLDEPGLAGQPLALVHEAKGALRVTFASGTAQREGIRAGMTLTAARALLPALRDGLYDAVAEAQALSSLAEGFLRFTPAFMLSAPDGLWLDASAASLFGGEAGLVEKVEAQARAAGYRARVVLASEPFTARALARFGAATRACVAPGGSERALAALPVQALEDAPEVVASLRALGLSTLGELSALQPTQVISRLGAQGLRAQRLVRGQDESRLLPAVLPEVVEEVRTLEAPAESLEPLLFALKTALDRLSARLRGRQRAAVRLTLTLVLEPTGPYPVPLALARPTTDPKLLLDLVRHRLESVRLDGPVATLVVTVDESCEDRGQQGVLGDAPAGDAALEAVLARLATALGPEALGSPVLADDHRPEAAHAPGPFRPPRREPGMFAEARRAPPAPPPPPPAPGGRLRTCAGAQGVQAQPDWQLERPLRLLSGEGEPIEVELDALGALRSARVLGRRRKVLAVTGPERLGGQWWTESPFQRDYYRVHLEGLGAAWVYRRAGEGEFFLHGLFD